MQAPTRTASSGTALSGTSNETAVAIHVPTEESTLDQLINDSKRAKAKLDLIN
jgi:hypothetical protein